MITKGRQKQYRDTQRKKWVAAHKCQLCGGANRNQTSKNCWRCRRYQQVQAKRKRREIGLEVLAYYGGKCACCGEATVEFLSIDHIDGSGAAHRRADKNCIDIKLWLWRRNFPKGFQVLCMNCNHAKGRRNGNGKCPHKRLRHALRSFLSWMPL